LNARHALWERWSSNVEFAVVYISGAHPGEGWVVTPNRDEGILVNDPSTNEERELVAAACALHLQIRMPVVVDEVDDAIASEIGR
jgi:hypothetical protein